ncbi:protein-ER retention receptor [Favolaschia claudopus]|uniref:Protein-ER retention receptor n=1 Tax=Favolaschia claudopus TaxID=2862362 RepID=A0AAW0A5I2_9AGAR
MNIFRLLGDLAHLISKGILIFSIHRNKSAEGVSFLTQAMYALVFLARYPDLFYRFVSLYNTTMKIVYVVTAFYVLILMHSIYPRSTEGRLAWQITAITLALAALVGLIFNYVFTFTEIAWSFSIALEAFCVIPQLILLRETSVPTVITSFYLLALGSYRALYIPNWIYRYFTEGIVDPIAVTFGIIQTALYLDFAYVYYSRQRIKLRDGVLVDSEDYERGWIIRWFRRREGASLQSEEGAAEEGRIALPVDDAEPRPAPPKATARAEPPTAT